MTYSSMHAQVTHTRTGKTIRLSAPSKLFAQRRETIETAYPGDIVGFVMLKSCVAAEFAREFSHANYDLLAGLRFVNPGAFSIGDTISSKKSIKYEGIPSFSPEFFNWIRNPNPSKQKQFKKGVSELREEGAVQVRVPSGERHRMREGAQRRERENARERERERYLTRPVTS
jgi:peptide chain release factor 3